MPITTGRDVLAEDFAAGEEPGRGGICCVSDFLIWSVGFANECRNLATLFSESHGARLASGRFHHVSYFFLAGSGL